MVTRLVSLMVSCACVVCVIPHVMFVHESCLIYMTYMSHVSMYGDKAGKFDGFVCVCGVCYSARDVRT